MDESHSRVSEQLSPALESTGDILRSVLDTDEQSNPACNVMIGLADEGFLDQHQTSTALDTVAERLLDTL